MIQISEDWQSVEFKEIVSLYHTIGWVNYTKDEVGLRKAFENSSFVALVFYNKTLVGLVRCLSDDVSIHYLQDVLVLPDYHNRGIGKELVKTALKRFSHVRTHMLLTDNEEKQIQFYQSCGYSNLKDFKDGSLNSFIRTN